MVKIRGVFFDLYGTLLRYGAMDSAWADWLHCPATSAPDEPKTCFCGAFSFAQWCLAVAAHQLAAIDDDRRIEQRIGLNFVQAEDQHRSDGCESLEDVGKFSVAQI